MPEWRNWYTHTTQNRASKGLRVRVPPPAPMNKILVILGPTATGKSDLAVRLAKKYSGEIISADSRQVYKGLDIGTGKITKKEMSGIPHYMLDVTTTKKVFTVSDWKKKIDKLIPEIISHGKIPIICGGTGFYIQSVVDGIVLPEVPPNKTLRKKLGKKSLLELNKILKKLDPKRAKNIDKDNPTRLIRAIEIAKYLGLVPEIKKQKSKYEFLQIGLRLPEKELKIKIDKRVLLRMKKGIVREARELHKRGLSFKRMRGLGLEYRYLADYIDSKFSKKEFIKKLDKEIWNYTKRQMTWFKRDKRIKWFRPKQTKEIHREIDSFLA